MLYESENTEFKSQYTEGIYKSVIAFANAGGGTIYVGMNDDGTVIGLDDVDACYTRITNGIRDAIQPDVTMFLHYVLQEDRVIRIEVGEGTGKPYYLKSKGMKPAGVYIRQGASSVPASGEQIRRMIKDADGDVFECRRSVNQDLTFDETADAFARRKMDFGTDKFPALGLVSLHDGQYTNLAALMSDQCRHTIKVAVFQDEERTIFRDTREFTGSVLRQLEDVYEYLHLCNRTAGVIQGLVRREQSDYPEEALREALLNAIIHRDYSFSGSTIINVNDTCMEFISLGGLLQGLTVDDIRSGISLPRNRNLAAIFHRLKLIEAYGTGIRRIYSLYQSSPSQPQIIVTPNVFKLILPNTNAAAAVPQSAAGQVNAAESGSRNTNNAAKGSAPVMAYPVQTPYSSYYKGEQQPYSYYGTPCGTALSPDISFVSELQGSYGEHSRQKPTMTAQMRTVMQYLSDNGEISTEGLQKLLDVKQTRAYVIARQMQDAGYIESTGRGTGRRYRIK